MTEAAKACLSHYSRSTNFHKSFISGLPEVAEPVRVREKFANLSKNTKLVQPYKDVWICSIQVWIWERKHGRMTQTKTSHRNQRHQASQHQEYTSITSGKIRGSSSPRRCDTPATKLLQHSPVTDWRTLPNIVLKSWRISSRCWLDLLHRVVIIAFSSQPVQRKHKHKEFKTHTSSTWHFFPFVFKQTLIPSWDLQISGNGVRKKEIFSWLFSHEPEYRMITCSTVQSPCVSAL